MPGLTLLQFTGQSMTFHGLRPWATFMARATNDVREINLMVTPA